MILRHQKSYHRFYLGKKLFSMQTSTEKKDVFMSLKQFAVVGASNDREKFGNKILRCYVKNGKLVIPINPKDGIIEGLKAESSLKDMLKDSSFDPSKIGISIVTAPEITSNLVKTAYDLGFRNFWFQPGTTNKEVVNYVNASKDGLFIDGCVLVHLKCTEFTKH